MVGISAIGFITWYLFSADHVSRGVQERSGGVDPRLDGRLSPQAVRVHQGPILRNSILADKLWTICFLCIIDKISEKIQNNFLNSIGAFISTKSNKI
jgi:hypothetical protein